MKYPLKNKHEIYVKEKLWTEQMLQGSFAQAQPKTI